MKKLARPNDIQDHIFKDKFAGIVDLVDKDCELLGILSIGRSS
jgi:hypothetical protein